MVRGNFPSSRCSSRSRAGGATTFSVHLTLLSRHQPGRFFWHFARVLLKTISFRDGGLACLRSRSSSSTSCWDVPFTSHLRVLLEPTCRWTPSLVRRVPGHGPLKVASPPGRFAVELNGHSAGGLGARQTLSRGPCTLYSLQSPEVPATTEERVVERRLHARTQGRTGGRSFKLNVTSRRAVSVQGVF